MEIIVGLLFVVSILISMAWISIRELIKGIKNKRFMSFSKGIIGIILVFGSFYFVYTLIWIFINSPGSEFL